MDLLAFAKNIAERAETEASRTKSGDRGVSTLSCESPMMMRASRELAIQFQSQLVITCDRLPRALTAIEQRLRERFEAGLVAEITPPDHATRVAILYKRAALDGIEIADPEVLEMVADRVTDNIRALEGALIRVVAFHSLTRRPIDPALTASSA